MMIPRPAAAFNAAQISRFATTPQRPKAQASQANPFALPPAPEKAPVGDSLQLRQGANFQQFLKALGQLKAPLLDKGITVHPTEIPGKKALLAIDDTAQRSSQFDFGLLSVEQVTDGLKTLFNL